MNADKKYQELDEEIVNFFKKAETEFNMPLSLRYVFQGVSTLNKLILITKVQEHYVDLVKADLLVQVNPIYFDSFDESTNKILFDNEIDKISFDMNKGTIKIVKPKIMVASGVGSKYGFESVLNALEAEKLIKAQLKDKSADANGKI